MLNCINILSQGLFDYAGLFPPAQLSLDHALSNFARYQNDPQNNMLGKFILPAESCNPFLTFLEKNPLYFENFKDRKALFSILLSKCPEYTSFEKILLNDFKNLKKVYSQTSHHFQIQSFEISAPHSILQDKKIAYNYLETLNKIVNNFEENISFMKNKISPLPIRNCGQNSVVEPQVGAELNMDIFIEVPFLKEETSLLIETLSYFNSQHNKILGLKIRAGGITPEQIPTTSALSKVILKACENNLPIKLTAGLHLPVRNVNTEVGAKMHGYLNVICAIFLPYIYNDLSTTALEKKHMLLLENEDENYFKCTESGLYFQEKLIGIDQLIELKRKYLKGIGTCDFIEPTRAMQDLGTRTSLL